MDLLTLLPSATHTPKAFKLSTQVNTKSIQNILCTSVITYVSLCNEHVYIYIYKIGWYKI